MKEEYEYIPNGLENDIKNVVYKDNFNERVGRETGTIDIVGFEIGIHSCQSWRHETTTFHCKLQDMIKHRYSKETNEISNEPLLYRELERIYDVLQNVERTHDL